MTKRPTVNLSVHRNTVEARRKRVRAAEARANVAALIKEKDIRAYAFVGIAADGKPYALWDTGSVVPMWAFADMVGRILYDDMSNSEVDDDWRPALNGKG